MLLDIVMTTVVRTVEAKTGMGPLCLNWGHTVPSRPYPFFKISSSFFLYMLVYLSLSSPNSAILWTPELVKFSTLDPKRDKRQDGKERSGS